MNNIRVKFFNGGDNQQLADQINAWFQLPENQTYQFLDAKVVNNLENQTPYEVVLVTYKIQ